jgi:hypothetical protein
MHGNSMAISAGQSTVEHAVIEACGLLADGAPYVLLVVADAPLPELFTSYADCREHACGWSWLMQAADEQGCPSQPLAAMGRHDRPVSAGHRPAGRLPCCGFSSTGAAMAWSAMPMAAAGTGCAMTEQFGKRINRYWRVIATACPLPSSGWAV